MAETRWTPERAKQAGRRWRWAGVVIGLLASTVSLIGINVLTVPLLGVAGLCLLESADLSGWRRGYLAREREERQSREGSGVSHG